uniref:Membrane-associated progesterone receptor component 1 n=1 Tax=Ascaris suum TaxID=6253 RepID=F1L8C1_ASCSU
MDFASVFELGWVDVVLIAFLVYVIYRMLVKKGEPAPLAPKPPPPMKKRDFTVSELREYNGVDNERILMAVCGKVFDVTIGKAFYGPGGAYGSLAGHDATRALATMDVGNVKDEYDDTSDLQPYELNDAKEWADRLSYKYPTVGRLLKDDEEPNDYKGELASL